MGSFFYIAKVSDNKDEDGLNRIKVTTTLDEETVSFWIPYLSSIAGNECGISALPDIDDQVLVLADGPARNTQIAIGGFWNANSAPPKTEENSDGDLNSDGNNAMHYIKSKTGNMLIFDDTDGAEKLQIIASGAKSRVDFSPEDELVSFETDKEFAVKAKGEFSLEAEEINIKGKKAVTVECEDFGTKSSKEMKIEASKDMTLKGSGIALN